MSWSDRWRELFDDPDPQVRRRLAQGRAWERSGRVTQVAGTSGVLTGRVQGTRATPHAVEVTMPALDDGQWAVATDLLASEVRHGARLLAGHAPQGLEAELDAAGVPLFPRPDEMELGCSCQDPVRPCAHLGGVLEAVAAQLDDDPFLLFRLRGRGRERLLAEVAASRRRGGGPEHEELVPLTDLEASGWAQARAPLDGVPLPDVDPPPVTAGPLRVLGDPPGWPGGVSAWDLFRPLVERAARWSPDPEGGQPAGP